MVPHMIKKHESVDEQNIEKAGMEHAPPPRHSESLGLASWRRGKKNTEVML